MRVGIFHHLGWAVAVTATADHRVVDRRRLELVEPGMPPMPIHHHRNGLDDVALGMLVEDVRASAQRSIHAAFDALATAVAEPIMSVSLRAWPRDFPSDIATQRRAPYEAKADSVMYRQVLAQAAGVRRWAVHLFEANDVEEQASAILGARARELLHGPRAYLGPPWTRDHRLALAATIVAGAESHSAEP